ncbi:MAG: DUF1343 domain-containing protein [Chlorobiaceae bacterium]|nr:DUF1343 domain-containing protein [Chlorobiaceae bacterium]
MKKFNSRYSYYHLSRNLALMFFFLFLMSTASFSQRVRLGAEILLEKHLDSLKGKRIGIICNQTSVLPDGTHLVDTLLALGVDVKSLFAPEHGIRGDKPAGEKILSGKDNRTGLTIHSLYGGSKKPDEKMLHDVDLLIFDMQDVGARFYTYASTMAYCMIAAAENNKKFIVLDRPNPINGTDIEGPPLDLMLISFLGMTPIPVRHGLTIGEIAKMMIGEGYLNPSSVDLTVIPMEGWKRSMWYDETGLPWISPSPNMKTLQTATVYPGSCLFEATNISEGRGTSKPFEYIGAPKLNNVKIVKRLNSLKLPGVKFSAVEFTPQGDTATGSNPKFNKKLCRGVYIQITDRKVFKPVITGLMMIDAIRKLYPKSFILKKGLFSRLIGDELVSDLLEKGKIDQNSFKIFDNQIDQYLKIRSKYLLY